MDGIKNIQGIIYLGEFFFAVDRGMRKTWNFDVKLPFSNKNQHKSQRKTHGNRKYLYDRYFQR